MANRYWVGGAGTWSASATANWASSSGGAGGASAPTSADNVFFDANSGTGTCTYQSGAVCFDLNTTNTSAISIFPNANDVRVDISGSVTLGANLVMSTGSFIGGVNFVGSGTQTITSNGFAFGGTLLNTQFYLNHTGTVSLADALNVLGVATQTSNNFRMSSGTFTTNDFTVSVRVWVIQNAGTKVVNLGASTVNLTNSASSNTVWNHSGATNLTFNAGTSTISVNGSSGTKTFAGGGYTYNTVKLGATTGSAVLSISGANTFGDIQSARTNAATIRFTAGVTQTVGAFTASGTAGNLLSIISATAGSQFTLSKASGSVSISYVSLKDCAATGGASFTATNSTDAGNNTGWSFGATTYPVTLTVTQGKTVSVTKQAQWGKTLTAASSTSLVKQAQALRSVTQASTITLATMRLANVVLSIVQATSTTLLKTAIKPLAVAQAAAASATKMIAKEVLLAGTSSALVSKTVAQTRALSQGTSVSLAKTIGQVRAVVAAAATAGVIKMASRTFGLNTAVIVRMLRNGAVWPDPADVAEGVLYGPNGSDYVGTKKGGGGYFRRR